MNIQDFRLRRYYNLLKILARQKEKIDFLNISSLKENIKTALSLLEKVAQIFHKEESKEAEKILVEFWSYDSYAVKFFILLSLLDALSKEKKLSPETTIKLEQIRGHPAYSWIYDLAVSELRRLKAAWN